MALISRYNALDCTIMVDGVFITGLGENMVSWEKQEPYFEPSVGAQGDVIKNETNNDLHTLTIGIQITSPQYGYLMELAKRKDPFPVWVANKSIGITVGGTMASVQEAPNVSLGQSAEDAEIVFLVFDGETKADA